MSDTTEASGTVTKTELSDNEKALLSREVAADDYDRQWPLRTTLGNLSREGFISGWDAAMAYIEQQHIEQQRREERDGGKT